MKLFTKFRERLGDEKSGGKKSKSTKPNGNKHRKRGSTKEQSMADFIASRNKPPKKY
jgi:hypothetical protein